MGLPLKTRASTPKKVALPAGLRHDYLPRDYGVMDPGRGSANHRERELS